MSKIMSMFEKLNLVEKVNDQTVSSKIADCTDIVEECNNDTVNDEAVSVSGATYINIVEEHNNEIDMKNNQSTEEKNESITETNLIYDKNMDIKEIYSLFGVESKNNHTIFKLEKFINAIPENLPYEVKKQSVISIIEASDTDLNMLLSDGEKRLNVLKKFGNEYYNETIKSIEEQKTEIIKLNNLINKYKEQIHSKESLLEEQNNVLKFETEKITKTINFFKDGD